MITGDDHAFMARALALAERGAASTDPNPTVGCVIVDAGTVVGEGFTQRAGGPHAEIEALAAAGTRARGATVYVSLEPCAHTGRTGPCTTALVEAGVARVVYAVDDPNPEVAGRGRATLEAAGIAVASPLLAAEAERMNRGFFARMRRGRPWVRCKLAASLDGRTALANGQSQWITGAAARRDVHCWRAKSSAVMTGIGTVLADNPALTARPGDLGIDVLAPKRIVVDARLATPPTARVLAPDGEVIVFAVEPQDAAARDRRRALEARGARVETVPAEAAADDAAALRCDLVAVAERLGRLGINSVWLESGPVLAGAMLARGLVDELVLYLAPSLLGSSARGLFELPPLESLDARYRLAFDDVRRIGEDLRIVARPEPRGA